jgi:hypothetical protein
MCIPLINKGGQDSEVSRKTNILVARKRPKERPFKIKSAIQRVIAPQKREI